MNQPLVVRPITADEHLAVVTDASGPSSRHRRGATVKVDWRHESLGWFDGADLVGAALVLYRSLPRTSRALAYLPEGPVIDWQRYPTRRGDRSAARAPASSQGVLGEDGPACRGPSLGDPARSRTRSRPTTCLRLSDVPADATSSTADAVVAALRGRGWTRQSSGAGFGDFQPRYVFQVPLAGRTTR